MIRRLALALGGLALAACSNDPYPGADGGARVLYVPYAEAPKTLDPQVAYSVYDHEVTANLYETALEYHYLKRPYELIPALVKEVPVPEPRRDGRIVYRFEVRRGMRYAADPCFALGAPGAQQRDVLLPSSGPSAGSPDSQPSGNASRSCAKRNPASLRCASTNSTRAPGRSRASWCRTPTASRSC
ncbi:MAG: hypothetical protein MUF70_08945 [Myxococcota bacterium]|nr:hypothetical protein [Myxococcota bacterium]